MKPVKTKPVGIAIVLTALLLSGGRAASDPGQSREPDPITVRAGVDRDSVTIGDKIKYTVTVSTRRNVEVEFPDFAGLVPGFAVRDFGSSEKTFLGRKTLIQWYLFDTYATGEYVIPKLVIRYRPEGEEEWRRLETGELTIKVNSVLEEGASEIKDIKGPVSLPGRLPLFLIVGLILAVTVAVVLGTLLVKKGRLAAPSPVPGPPAHEVARRLLERLKQKDYPRRGKIKEYYVELSRIVRRYLEDRFNLRAPEMTTEEFLFTIKDSRRLAYEHKSLLREFLAHCDLVKFARYGPSADEIESSFAAAVNLVEQTKAVGS